MAARFLAELEGRAPELLPWAPLIAMAIGVTVPETPESRDLEEEFRRPRLASAVIELLAKLLPDAGLFVIEDAHNMDEASADLFGHLAAAVGRHLLAVVHDQTGPSIPASSPPKGAAPGSSLGR